MRKNKVFVIAILATFLTAGLVFAAAYDQPMFSGKGTGTLSVQNLNRTGTLEGSVCINFTDAAKRSQSVSADYKVAGGKTQYIPVTGTITSWSNEYCVVSE